MNPLPDIEDTLSSLKCNTMKGCQSQLQKQEERRRMKYGLKDIIQNGLCMGCGLCVSIANDNDNEVGNIKAKLILIC